MTDNKSKKSEGIRSIVYSLHVLERKVLPSANLGHIDKIAKDSKLSAAEVRTAVDLLVERGYVICEKLETKYIGLDKFGEKYVGKVLPEIKFLKKIISKPKKQSELGLDSEEFSSAIGILKKNKLVEIKKEKDEMLFSATSDAKKYLDLATNPLDLFKEDVASLLASDAQNKAFEEMKSRKGFLREYNKVEYNVLLTDKGKEIADEVRSHYMNLDLTESLTSDMLKNGSWKDKKFRYYDISLDVPIQDIGRRHPMMEANNVLRDVFIEMGFCEMIGPMVESPFWNMDLLWIPQDHPARDEQDTFYLEGETKIPEELIEKVIEMHEKGIKRGHTPQGEWSREIASKRLLRTHSTATTFRYLYELGLRLQAGENVDGKYFYNANVFRNEAIDATHLAEFFQAEGFIIGDDLSLADLMGFVKEYYAKLGITKIKFKPTFNPYTEPSMEAHYYDPKLKKWYALINSGIFRKETLEPLGLGSKTIIAWGMGASRVATLLSGKTSMRDITGATCDFEWLRNRPIMKREIVRK